MAELFLAKGKRGIVSLTKWNGRPAAVKRANPSSNPSTASTALVDEARFLKRVNTLKIGPKLHFSSKNEVIMEYAKGDRILDFISTASRKEILAVCTSVLNQCRRLDNAGISKNEMADPYKHILVERKKGGKLKTVMIDFERAQLSKKPKNVTQFVQFLTSGKFNHAAGKKVSIDAEDAEKFRQLAREYKKTLSAENFRKILHSVEMMFRP